jgi:hypothetical protein
MSYECLPVHSHNLGLAYTRVFSRNGRVHKCDPIRVNHPFKGEVEAECRPYIEIQKELERKRTLHLFTIPMLLLKD